jgi:hypothetical protein
MPGLAQIRGRQAFWLLDLDLSGRVFRFATQDLEVDDHDGRTFTYRAGLGTLRVSRAAASISVEVASDGAADWAKLEAHGVDLASGTATLRRWFERQDLEAAEVVITGRIGTPEFGPVPRPLTFSILDSSDLERTVVPPPEMVVDETTWPMTGGYVVDDPAYGEVYPLVIGYPGGLPNAILTTLSAAATPAPLVEYAGGALTWAYSKLVIAGHPVEATSVRVYDLSDGIYEDLDVSTMQDGRGRTVSYVDFFPAASLRAYPGHAYACAFLATYGGGLKWRGRVLRKAGELLVYLLTENLFETGQYVKTRVDVGAQEAQRAYFDRWNIDCVIDDSTDVLSWIRGHLMKILPMREVRGRNGIYFAAWRWDATAKEAVTTLNLSGGLVELVERVKTSPNEVYNEFRLQFAKRLPSGYVRTLTLTGQPDDDDATIRGSYLCRISQQREATRTGGNGVRTMDVSSDVLWDPSSAALTLSMWAYQHALPPRPVAVQGGAELEALRIGDVVLVSHAGLYWTDRVALVEDVTSAEGGRVQLDLQVLQIPSRATRRTS